MSGNSIDIRMSFEHRYSVEVTPDLPSDTRRDALFFYPGKRPYGNDGVALRVRLADGSAWYGVFAFGRISRSAISGVYACPSSDQLCVVSKGDGYIVSVSSPTDWSALPLFGILAVHVLALPNLLLLSDSTDLLAYGERGIEWHSERIVDDELVVRQITGERVSISGWSAPQQQKMNLIIDGKTGGIISVGTAS